MGDVMSWVVCFKPLMSSRLGLPRRSAQFFDQLRQIGYSPRVLGTVAIGLFGKNRMDAIYPDVHRLPLRRRLAAYVNNLGYWTILEVHLDVTCTLARLDEIKLVERERLASQSRYLRLRSCHLIHVPDEISELRVVMRMVGS